MSAALWAPDTDRINVDFLRALGGVADLTVRAVDVITENNAKGKPQSKARLHVAEHALPYIPGAMMGRALQQVWGDDPAGWVGRRLRVYVDAGVTMGRDVVGGVRVSHVSGIDAERVVMVTTRRGQRSPWSLLPMPQRPVSEIVDMLAARYPAHADRILAVADGAGTDDEKRAALRAVAAEVKT